MAGVPVGCLMSLGVVDLYCLYLHCPLERTAKVFVEAEKQTWFFIMEAKR